MCGDNNNNELHSSIIINENNDNINLIESGDYNIRIWNFHSGELLKKINVTNLWSLYLSSLGSICVWNNDYLFVRTSKELKLIEINSGKIIRSLETKETIITVRKINLPNLGECLITQAKQIGQISVWAKGLIYQIQI